MNQDGTNTSIYGLCITGAISILAQITLNQWVGVFAILAAISTITVNVINIIRKNKNK